MSEQEQTLTSGLVSLMGAGQSARFDGDLRVMKIKYDARDLSLDAAAVATVHVGGDLANASFKLHGAYAHGSVAMKRFNVHGLASDVVVRSMAHLGIIQAGAFHDATFFAGVDVAVSTGALPSDPAIHFNAEASIAGIRVTGLKGLDPWMRGAHFAAWRIGAVSSGYAAADGGDRYGFAAVEFGRFTYRDTNGRVVLRPNGQNGGAIPIAADLILSVI